MSRKMKSTLAALAAILPWGVGFAANLQVPADFATIQAAIGAAVNGDSVTVAQGVYPENIDFLGKNIVVASSGDALFTTIDGGAAGSVVSFVNGETRDAVLRGFTIRNGLAFEGGGITVQNSSPTIEGNRIVANRACDGAGIGVGFGSPLIRSNQIIGNVRSGCSGGNGGGGILLRGAGSAIIVTNVISQNNSGGGGAISLFAAGTPYIGNNVMSRNTADGAGGAMSMANSSDAVLVQNLIYFNYAPSEAGGITWLVPSGSRGPILINNTIARNRSLTGASAIFADGFDSNVRMFNNILEGLPGIPTLACGTFDPGQPVLINNDVYRPDGPAYGADCVDVTGLGGNISAAPSFASPLTGDFRLQPGSPAIDTGLNLVLLPAVDLYGGTRILDGDGSGTATVDMGVDEFAPAL